MKKKRILCSLLTLAMLMALLTVTAFAEGEAALTLPTGGGTLASGTYQLREDLTISHSLNIPSGKDITIDLNGHTLNTTAAVWGVWVHGTCKIVDSAENGTIESGEHAFGIISGGNLSINGGTTNASGTAIVNAAGAVLTISNAKVSSSSSKAPSSLIPVLQNQGIVTIQGAELSGNTAAGVGILNVDGSVTVSDSTIYGAYNGILNICSISISNSTVSSSRSYAVDNYAGSSLTATGTNFIAVRADVICNAGTLSIDAASSLTISDVQAPGRIEGNSTGVLCQTGKFWQEVVAAKPDGYYEENKIDKTLTISSPEALAWWAKEIKKGISFAEYTITISGTLNMSAHLWEPINAWGSPAADHGLLDGVTIQGQCGETGYLRNAG